MRLQFRPAVHPIPLYIGALALETVDLAGETADGVMLYLSPPERVKIAIDRLRRSATKGGRNPDAIDVTLGIPIYLSDDIEAARAAARRNLVFSGSLPFYNRLFRKSGFVTEAEGMSQGMANGNQAAAAAAVSDAMIDSMCLVGPAVAVASNSRHFET